MNRYNKLKLQALSVFERANGEWLSPDTAADRLNFSPKRSAWTYFKRLWGFGLLERRSWGRGTLQYRLSVGGNARLVGHVRIRCERTTCLRLTSFGLIIGQDESRPPRCLPPASNFKEFFADPISGRRQDQKPSRVRMLRIDAQLLPIRSFRIGA